MTKRTLALVVGAAMLLTACVESGTATRNSSIDTSPEAVGKSTVSAAAAVNKEQLKSGQSPVTVTYVQVVVPSSLKVSEANSYLPKGDIVWREDPIGNRHDQVGKIVKAAMERGVSELNGPVPVILEIEVRKFHALTERARYTVGGVHGLSFVLTVRDARNGEAIMPPRMIRADLDAFGGAQALRAEAKGQTQKVRITNHLAEVIRQELTNPNGYKNATLGFIQALNYM